MTVRVLHVLCHALPFIPFLLIFVWMSAIMKSYVVKTDGSVLVTSLGGFSWTEKSDLVFNWHPVLMALGFIFFSSQAVLVFVTKPFGHYTNKLIHITCHLISIVSVTIATIAIFKFHNEHGYKNLRSLHSWVGITTIAMFGGQYIVGFIVYFFPGASMAFRKESMPYHIGFGLGIMGMISITFVSGILEQLSFNASCDVSGVLDGQVVASLMTADCVVGCISGISIVILFLCLIVTVWVSKHPVDPKPPISNDDIKSPLLKH